MLGQPRSRAVYYEPGEYRQEQNFIGKSRDISKSRFNPPPPPTHIDCISKLEKFINSELDSNIAPLVFLALIHYQFETIHPFPDGNGRVGRLLIPIILKNMGVMDQPLLYMSQYFEDNKDEYVELLLKVSQKSDWISWITFFLKGVCVSSEKTIDTIHKVQKLQDEYRAKCQQARSSALLLKIIDKLFERGVTTVTSVQQLTGTSYTGAKNNITKLLEYGIIKELPRHSHPKYYYASELFGIFEN
jgi:Fic family protein